MRKLLPRLLPVLAVLVAVQLLLTDWGGARSGGVPTLMALAVLALGIGAGMYTVAVYLQVRRRRVQREREQIRGRVARLDQIGAASSDAGGTGTP